MTKKFFLAAAALLAFTAASFATDYVRVDLNFWCNGNLKCLSKSAPGIQITGRRKYSNPKYANICYYSITINLEKAQEIDLVYEVVDTGDADSAVVKPSIEPIRLIDGKRSKEKAVECLEFEFDGEPSPLVPCTVTGWKGLNVPVTVSAGSKITIKAKFKKVQ